MFSTRCAVSAAHSPRSVYAKTCRTHFCTNAFGTNCMMNFFKDAKRHENSMFQGIFAHSCAPCCCRVTRGHNHSTLLRVYYFDCEVAAYDVRSLFGAGALNLEPTAHTVRGGLKLQVLILGGGSPDRGGSERPRPWAGVFFVWCGLKRSTAGGPAAFWSRLWRLHRPALCVALRVANGLSQKLTQFSLRLRWFPFGRLPICHGPYVGIPQAELNPWN